MFPLTAPSLVQFRLLCPVIFIHSHLLFDFVQRAGN
jgi:hypothetical protein